MPPRRPSRPCCCRGSPPPSCPPDPSPVNPLIDRNALRNHVPSTPPSPHRSSSSTPPPSLSHGRDSEGLQSESVVVRDNPDGFSPASGSSVDSSRIPTSDQSNASPADSTTARTTPQRSPNPNSPPSRLVDDESRGPGGDGSNQLVGTRMNKDFVYSVYLIGADCQKEPMRLLMDTGSAVNILARDKAEALGFELEPSDEVLCPLSTGMQKVNVPVDGMVSVDWHFQRGKITYTTDFLVADINDNDVILGRHAICDYVFLRPGDDVPGEEGEVRWPGP
ncbi:hypothetical protein BDV59DRAFT_12651 [Aspergillus ambiguus]|uniref:retropepsin-like aspartic protease n=1 Tax=Aspergillus ambiguus TaxID=176160 RepID=UPI003CCD5C9C